MGSRRPQGWRAIVGRPLNEKRMDTYQRVIDAEELLDGVRRRRGLPETAIADALDSVEGDSPAIEPVDDLYLETMVRYVAGLGGHIEVRAVFADETVTLLREPEVRGG